MTQSILNGFLIFSIIQAFLFAGLFVSKQNRSSADYTITLLLLLLAVHSFLILVNLNNDYTALFRIMPITLTLLYGPLLLSYVTTLRSEVSKIQSTIFLHLIPFLIFLLLTVFLSDNLSFQKILSLSGAVSGLLYCLLTLFSIKKHKKRIVDLYSTTKGVSLSWLNKVVKGIVFIWAGAFILVFLKQVLQINIYLNWFFIFIPLFISYIGYHGFKQQVIIQVAQVDEDKINSEIIAIPTSDKQLYDTDSSYKKSGLLNQDMEKIFSSLELLMKTNKLYLESNLNLQDLAEKANFPQHHITQTLNSFAKQNFHDYINSYRVNEFIQKLKNGDGNNFSLLGIAFDCGFNSKSSFNRIFKNSTGQSPSEYKNSLSKQAD